MNYWSPRHKNFDRTLEICQLPSNEKQLLVISGDNRQIQINCGEKEKADSVVTAIV